VATSKRRGIATPGKRDREPWPHPAADPADTGGLGGRPGASGAWAVPLYQERIRRGYRGSEGMVRIVVRPWRLRQALSPPARTPAQLAWLLLKPAERLTAAERRGLEDYLDANPVLAHGDQLKTRFHALLTAHDPAALEQWLREAESSDLPSFRALARRFRQDDAAIVAALTTPWSMGRCEGPICRVKWLKRLGYGRAKLDFLRQRSLHRRAAPLTGAEQELQVPQQVAA
jgi:hypothetical protein